MYLMQPLKICQFRFRYTVCIQIYDDLLSQSSVFRKIPVQNMLNFAYDRTVTSHISDDELENGSCSGKYGYVAKYFEHAELCSDFMPHALTLSFLFPFYGMEWHTQSKRSRQMKKLPTYLPTYLTTYLPTHPPCIFMIIVK
jgi:hypothetical protein